MRRSPILALLLVLSTWILGMGSTCDSAVTPQRELTVAASFRFTPSDAAPGDQITITGTVESSFYADNTDAHFLILDAREDIPEPRTVGEIPDLQDRRFETHGNFLEVEWVVTLPDAQRYLIVMFGGADTRDDAGELDEQAHVVLSRELVVTECGPVPSLDDIPISSLGAEYNGSSHDAADVTLELPGAALGEAYSHAFASRFSGGVGPFTYAIRTPRQYTFPTINAAGVLEGIPGEGGVPFEGGIVTTDIVVSDSCTPPRTFFVRTKIDVAPSPDYCPPLEFSSTLFADALPGEPYTQAVNTFGGKPPITIVVDSGQLPLGLHLEGNQITGAASFVGSENFVLRATDSCDPPTTVARNFTIRVPGNPSCSALSFANENPLPQGFVGTPYSVTFTGSGGIPPYVITEGSIVLPDGLTFADGVVSGTPTETGGGLLRIFVTDSCVPPQTVEKSFDFVITPAGCPAMDLAGNFFPDGAVGLPYSQTIAATGGVPPFTYTVISGSPPAGVTLATDGTLSGTPTAEGDHTFTVRATDSCATPQAKEANFRVDVGPAGSCPTLVIITTDFLTPGRQFEPYNFQLLTTGGVEPYTYSLTEGSLQTGLSLSSDGFITGTTTETSQLDFTVEVTDSCDPPQTTSKEFTLHIQPFFCPTLSFATVTLPSTNVDAAYDEHVDATGGEGAFTYAVTDGSLPPDLELSSDGFITGIATNAGTFNFEVSVTDECRVGAQVITRDFSIEVVDCPSMFVESDPHDGLFEQPYTYTFSSEGGQGVIRVRLESGPIPPGLTLNEDTRVLSGTPSERGEYIFNVTFFDECSPSQEETRQAWMFIE